VRSSPTRSGTTSSWRSSPGTAGRESCRPPSRTTSLRSDEGVYRLLPSFLGRRLEHPAEDQPEEE
jgi:hypothetical protein